jgi:hypothetical protein
MDNIIVRGLLVPLPERWVWDYFYENGELACTSDSYADKDNAVAGANSFADKFIVRPTVTVDGKDS